MSRSKKKQTIGYRYFVGVHMGICEGPVDALLELRSEDRTAWAGNVTASGQITVDAPTLFGGDEREGGLQGTVDVMMGEAAQTTNAYLTAQQGTPQSAYRGILGLVFRAFYWGNSPYLKPIATLARRILMNWSTGTAWYPEKASIAPAGIVAGGSQNFREIFAAGLSPEYTVTDPDHFTIVSTPYGNGLRLTNLADTTIDGRAVRTFAAAQYTAISFKGRVDINEAGSESTDADILFVILGKDGEALEDGITVALSRDATGTGSSERPSINDVPVGAAPLVVGEWYQFDFSLDWSAGEAAFSITRLSNGASFATGTTTIGIDSIDLLQFEGDIGSGERTGDAGTVADISLTTGSPVVGMNPAHIIYECLTDASFGMGYSTSAINEESFEAAADVFHAEGLGLCLHWTQQEPIDAFMQRVLDHAGAALVQHPRSGLFEIVPLRGGYDVEALPVFDESNIESVERYQKPSQSEATNEVTVRFTDVAAGPGKSGSVRVQNLANITAQGGVVSKTQQYPGIFHSALALRIAMRDLKAVSSPQAKVRLRVQRKAYTLTVGGLFRWNWSKLSISGMVLRVLKISYGSLTDSTIEIEAAEDVYSMPEATYGAEQPSGWVPTSTTPAAAALRLVREAHYYEAQLVLGATEAQALDSDAGYVIAAAVRPAGVALDFGMRTRVGAEAFAERDRGAFAPSGTLAVALGHGDTETTIESIVDGSLVEVGTYAQIDDEIVRIDAWNAGTGEVELGRGVLGTVAAAHAEGARIFFVDQFFSVDDTERLTGEEVDVRLTPRTSAGELAEASAPTDNVTLDQLISRPYAPGQLRIDGSAYPATVAIEDFAIAWKHRHRTQQNLEGDESGDIGPEDGTTYSLELTDADTDELLLAVDGIAGTSYEVDEELLEFDANVRVRLWSVRASLAAMALRSAFEVTRQLSAIGAPTIVWRFLLPAGWVDIVSITTVSGGYYEVRRYSAAGAIEATVYAYRVSAAAYDPSADVVAVGVYSLGGDSPSTASKVWIFDVSSPGLDKVEFAPDFPTPSGVEIISVAAAGGSIYAVNYDGSRCIRFDTDGVEQESVDDTFSRVFACDGTHLVFAISGGFARHDVSTLVHDSDVSFSPSATRIGKLHLVAGELVFLGDPSSGGLSTLYRYNATSGARIASYADVPFGASGTPNDAQFFTPYLSVGDTAAPTVFDTTDWSVVASPGGHLPLASAQRHDYVVEVTTGAGPAPASAWNPADKDADVTLSAGDTVATVVSAGSTGGVVRGSQSRNASDDRCFVLTYSGPDGRCCGGIAGASASLTSYPGQDAHGYGYYGVDGRSQNNGGSSAYGATYGNGAVVLYRLHSGTLTCYVWSGSAWVSQGALVTGLTGDWFPAWGPGSTEAGTRAATIDTDGGTWPAAAPGGAPWG